MGILHTGQHFNELLEGSLFEEHVVEGSDHRDVCLVGDVGILGKSSLEAVFLCVRGDLDGDGIALVVEQIAGSNTDRKRRENEERERREAEERERLENERRAAQSANPEWWDESEQNKDDPNKK